METPMLLKRLARRAAAILIVCLIGTNVSYVAAQTHIPGKSHLGGWVFIDINNDGEIAFSTDPNPEWMIANAVVSLYSQSGPETFIASTQTDQFGRFFFPNLDPGTYGLKQTQPVEYVDGIDSVGRFQALTSGGVPPNASPGTSANNEFNNIVLPANVWGDYFLFGERGLRSGYVSKRFLEGYEPLMEFGTDEPGFVIPEPATVWLVTAAAALGLTPRRLRRKRNGGSGEFR
jgi:hypothetical protein